MRSSWVPHGKHELGAECHQLVGRTGPRGRRRCLAHVFSIWQAYRRLEALLALVAPRREGTQTRWKRTASCIPNGEIPSKCLKGRSDWRARHDKHGHAKRRVYDSKIAHAKGLDPSTISGKIQPKLRPWRRLRGARAESCAQALRTACAACMASRSPRLKLEKGRNTER